MRIKGLKPFVGSKIEGAHLNESLEHTSITLDLDAGIIRFYLDTEYYEVLRNFVVLKDTHFQGAYLNRLDSFEYFPYALDIITDKSFLRVNLGDMEIFDTKTKYNVLQRRET